MPYDNSDSPKGICQADLGCCILHRSLRHCGKSTLHAAESVSGQEADKVHERSVSTDGIVSTLKASSVQQHFDKHDMQGSERTQRALLGMSCAS